MKAFISSRITDQWLVELKKQFSDLELYDWFARGMLSTQEFEKRIEGCHLVVTESDTITAEMIRKAENLFAIVDFRGTVINVDIDAANEKGVVILNTPGRNADAVADLTIALMIMAARNVLRGIDAFRQGLWTEKGRYWVYQNHQGYDLPGKTVGLIGLGAIGRLVTRRLSGFNVKIIGYDPFVSDEEALKMGVKKASLNEVFQKSDFLSLHLPLNGQTKNMFGEKELRMMKPNAYLINTSRAGVFQEDALVRCLKEGWIAGAALDVFHSEPLDSTYPLLNLPNVICTPHLGGATYDVIEHQSQTGVGGLLEFLHGNIPDNIINPEAIEKSIVRYKNYARAGG